MAIDAVTAPAAETTSQSYRLARNPAYEGQRSYSFEETLEMFDFWDVVDIINPLQHLPLIGTVYRELTGDEMGSFATVAGSALYGGGIGAVFGIANALVKESTGKDPGQLALEAFMPDDGTMGSTAETLADADLDAPLGADLLASGLNGQAATETASLLGGSGTVFTGITNPDGAASAAAQDLASTAYAAPLGGLLLSSETPGQWSQTAQQALATRAQSTDIPTLSTAQSAALAAFISHQSASGGSKNEPAQRVASTASGIPGTELAARTAVPPSAAADPGSQGQDMTQHESPTMQQGQDQSDSRDRNREDRSAATALPADIQRGRDALRERLAATRSAVQATTGLHQGAEASTTSSTMKTTTGAVTADPSRPKGRTLADYRRRPVTPAVDAGGGKRRTTTASSASSSSAINAGRAASVANLLPDPATMARVLEQGGTVANAFAEQAQRTAAAAAGLTQSATQQPITGGYPRPDAFRAMPVVSSSSSTTTSSSAPNSTTGSTTNSESTESETAPVMAQSWFSDTVVDAMRRYEAMRAAADPAT